jgi:hypothetical protein
MSPEKQRYCKQEIAELLERKLMKTTTEVLGLARRFM